MFVHNLTERIQTSIDQLGKLLDILYKFPQQQRKLYLDKIQSLKTQMTTLKNNLKQTNALNIERQYNSLVVSLNSFRSKIEDQNHLIANKENRSTNISRVNREGKSNHEEALRLIAEKEEQIGELRLTLFQKEELIKINYQELRDYKRDCNALVEENKSMKIDILELESELSAVNQHLNRLEEQASFLRVQKEQLQRQMKADNEALNRFSNELMIAKDRLLHFEKLAQISMMKSSMVEQNIKKVQEEACRLNQSYKAREEEAVKKDRSIEELKRQLSKKDSNIQDLTQENKQYKDECAALENQLSNYQRSMFELRSAHKQLKDTYDQEMRQWSRKFDDLQMRQKQKSIEAEDNQTKFMNVYNKNTQILEQIEQLRSQDKKSKNFIEELKQKMANYQSKNQALEYQNNELLEQKKKIISNLDECYSLISEKEQVVLQMSQKLQLRQIELAKTEELVHRYENMNKESESKKVSLQKSQLTLVSEIASYKNKIFHLQERNIFCEKGMLDLKKRLMKAKLQAIHDVRNTISQ